MAHTTSSARRWAARFGVTSCSSSAVTRARGTISSRRGRFRCRPRRCAAATCRPRRPPSTIRPPGPARERTETVSRKHHPGGSDRPDSVEAHQPDAAAEPEGRRRSVPLTNNYFVKAPFNFNRWTVDTKVNWNATPKLNIFGRYSQLDFWTFNETVYGDALQGMPVAGGNPGTGHGTPPTSRRAPHTPSPRPSSPMRTSATCACHRRRFAHRHRTEQRAWTSSASPA